MKDYTPGYIQIAQNGEMEERIGTLKEMLKDCVLCPHHCHVDRTKNGKGFCRAGLNMVIGGYGPHCREESALRNGRFSSATARYHVQFSKTVRTATMTRGMAISSRRIGNDFFAARITQKKQTGCLRKNS
ncbi:MAG TPA: hypothetical protein GX503_03475 [Clostridiales bacterium]|nr:hypothetical protein [Clostridiales bacterium]